MHNYGVQEVTVTVDQQNFHPVPYTCTMVGCKIQKYELVFGFLRLKVGRCFNL